ncbi:hypothetical protein TTHERM_01573220 (macronuclear) [Tetrahymena thermophila SB210]|uniref:Uncharacterized protein n=1 Tax=Tetrahymena thermophila (strain SB210) TaxID=312017 RepID=Q228H5_TETTS|nr:hypothetical protein TTHERM_01573220 [Tetrahymena thermophila SB210]EAR81693.1 hypothetical protein TTHERM_01573220 [Tetrahymena thermophila SB210]|eukprot:XP_001029356.1 hypothetical protein TTHERM_01573220 [Tetrahymena thermophila SB210]
MVTAIAAQQSLCQPKNRIQCLFSNLCQWNTNGICVESEVNEIVQCHTFINSDECGQYSTCTWNGLTCNSTFDCKTEEKFYMCKSHRECQWVDGEGCVNRSNDTFTCSTVEKFYMCKSHRECQWVDGEGCVNRSNDTFTCSTVEKFYMCQSHRECQWVDGKGCVNRSNDTFSCSTVDKFYMCQSHRECQWVDGVGCQNRSS